MTVRELALEPLTEAAFKPFGEVITLPAAVPERRGEPINQGHTERFADLAHIDVAAGNGHAVVHVYRSQPLSLPLSVGIMERHPLGSQAFVPLHARSFVVIVAPPGDAPERAAIRAFLTNGRQGVNLARGVWHHYQVTLVEPSDYLVIERTGPGENCEEQRIDPPLVIREAGLAR